ncbi:alpha-amylase family glycosyl hydrolase [Halorubrum halophilum]|uniref:alpha-amylase family glycosyl hydrolase n=1 Tax=Halorubrum halophilum TaxID=413816 RepID=UPI00067848FC|nr:alpha-amylase family glycosyl hydrolase [Halorubrum halophilum]
MSTDTDIAFPPDTDSSVVRVPAMDAETVAMRYSPLQSRSEFEPGSWDRAELTPTGDEGWYELDLSELELADGRYEYEFVVERGEDEPIAVPDPFAEDLTRFQGIRSTFRIRDGERYRPPFSWDDELPEGGLPGNHELVLYEFPPRWAAPATGGNRRNVADGDLQDLLTDHLDAIADLGVNGIELLPIMDSPDDRGWGYGTRFFFAPDNDLGGPIDTKFLIKECHRRGIRVFLDVVVNHATGCPLEQLADGWFFRHPDEQPERSDWGGRRFDFEETLDGYHPAQELLCRMGEYWVEEYHVDGFRIDEFKGADNWQFVQRFRDRTHAAHDELSADRPFLVVAEDSHTRAQIVRDHENNPDGRSVVDAMWNFDFQVEARRLLRDGIEPDGDGPARSERIEALIANDRTYDGRTEAFEGGFDDLSQAVNYITSHDVGAEGDQRLMNFLFGTMVAEGGLGDGSIENVRYLIDNLVTAGESVQIDAHTEALDRVRGAFAILLTSVGVPMILAGEEFAEIHDLDYENWQRKMEDPIDWSRREYPGHGALHEAVRDLIHLRTSTAALQRNEVELLHVHPETDDPDGPAVVAYCRPGDQPIGSDGQVVVVANFGPESFEAFEIPWTWGEAVTERGAPLRDGDLDLSPDEELARLDLAPYQVRVLVT